MTVTTASAKSRIRQEGVEALKRVRLLLMLWSMDGLDAPVKKSSLTDAIKGSGKASDFKQVFEDLQREGAIAIAKLGVSLLPKGLEKLRDEIQHSDFEFSTQVGAKTANALLRWIREMGSRAIVAAEVAPNGNNGRNGHSSVAKLASYEEFKQLALDVYNHLKQDYKFDQLVPIYRIRREIGERVTRAQFDEWLLEMQSNDIFQLIGGEMPEITSDQADDSIKTALGGIRYYAKAL